MELQEIRNKLMSATTTEAAKEACELLKKYHEENVHENISLVVFTEVVIENNPTLIDSYLKNFKK